MAEKQTPAPQTKPEVEESRIAEYIRLTGLARELSSEEQKQFTQFCMSYQLDPFRGEVHCSVYGEGEYRNVNFIVSFLTYVKRAELSGRLDGWAAEIEGEGEDTEAVVTIWRKDWSHEFRHRVHWKEAAQRKRDGSLTAFWRKMPRYLLKKTAIAQAFRLAFPAELAGMGYDEAELSSDLASDLASSPRSESPAPREAKPAERANGNTVRFPGRSPRSTPTETDGGSVETRDLVGLIHTMLSTNSLSFPKAHVDWIERELAKNPNRERLEQIIDHMTSVIGDHQDAVQTNPEREAEPAEQLIF